MNMSIGKEVYVFLCAMATGAGIYFLYDLFRLIRQQTQCATLIVQVQDAIFWVLSLCLMFFVMLHANNGSVRLYEFFGVALGAFLYGLLLSKVMRTLLRMILRFFSFFLKKILKFLLTPLLIMYNIMYRCARVVFCALFRKSKRFVRCLRTGTNRSIKLMKRK